MSSDHISRPAALPSLPTPLWYVVPLIGISVFLACMIVLESIVALAVFLWRRRPHWSGEK